MAKVKKRKLVTKEARITFRMTEELRTRLEAAAAADGRSLADKMVRILSGIDPAPKGGK